jgi:hypothetical protein
MSRAACGTWPVSVLASWPPVRPSAPLRSPYGMSADGGRRTGYAADMAPLGASYGDEMALPPVTSDWSKHTGGSDAQAYDPAG